MVGGKQFVEFTGGKIWVPSQNLRLLLICYVFAFILEFVISSELLHGLDENPVDPGVGYNFYGKAQNSKRKTLFTGGEVVRIFDEFQPRDCSKAPNGTTCIQQNRFYQDPVFIYEGTHPVLCDLTSPYRNYDGTCISPHIPILGMAEDCYFRFAPQYYDGYGGFRKSVEGKSLPEPRDISLKIFKDRKRTESKLSFQFLIFGQLVAHDMSRAVQPQTDCCLPANAQKEECTPISIRSNDTFYSRFNKTCMDFQRSDQCTFGKTKNREQKNGATAALDGSIIYGVSEKRVKELRTLDGTGKMKFTNSNGYSILPTGKDPEDIFCPKSIEPKCFLSGDPRVNQHAFLTIVQTIFLSEHNRLAEELKKLNPHWDDEKLFQEARKINIAIIQCLTYQDFLPILLTRRLMDDFDLTIKKGSAGSLFNPIAVIAVWHDWAHAAFRMHSAVPANVGSLNMRFKDTFLNPDLIRNGYTADLVEGSQKVPNEKLDRYMIKDLTNYLYQEPGVPLGKDLVSTNIQRGRDHGLAPYVEIVKFCSEKTVNITTFDQLSEKRIMSRRNVNLLKKVYG